MGLGFVSQAFPLDRSAWKLCNACFAAQMHVLVLMHGHSKVQVVWWFQAFLVLRVGGWGSAQDCRWWGLPNKCFALKGVSGESYCFRDSSQQLASGRPDHAAWCLECDGFCCCSFVSVLSSFLIVDLCLSVFSLASLFCLLLDMWLQHVVRAELVKYPEEDNQQQSTASCQSKVCSVQ